MKVRTNASIHNISSLTFVDNMNFRRNILKLWIDFLTEYIMTNKTKLKP